MGKRPKEKHKRSLEKLKGGSVITSPTSAPLVASAVLDNPFIGLQHKPSKVNSANGQDSGEKAVELVDNLEIKRRKVLEGEAATNEVHICLACNVVYNSETIFKTHLTDAMKKAAELIENLDTKTQKVLEGGASTNEVRKCLVCNVVCNSETVFRLHLAGKNHIANMKKQASGAGVVVPAN
ncbi:hypothetical protein RND71_019677 [Anisodus tanguticus]|uniref:C2H2-type domain-containing protein n=1 Tax=Anisodus tanguticus TaxID=243964 RepID=A0AAE1RZH5_9SOLA|nr:hypothetical protein RND71_019677 [Anisodus tanguticus]